MFLSFLILVSPFYVYPIRGRAGAVVSVTDYGPRGPGFETFTPHMYMPLHYRSLKPVYGVSPSVGSESRYRSETECRLSSGSIKPL